jgi:hypothetical protein
VIESKRIRVSATAGHSGRVSEIHPWRQNLALTAPRRHVELGECDLHHGHFSGFDAGRIDTFTPNPPTTEFTGGKLNRKRITLSAIAAGLALSFTVPASAASAITRGDSPASFTVKMVERSEVQTITDGETRTVQAASSAHYFTPQNPAYRGNDRNGHFTGQVKYGSSRLTFAWGYKLHASVSSAARGPMNESATATYNGRRTGYRDSHPGVPANYTVHSSFKVRTGHYVLRVNESFPITRGERKIHTTFDFIVTLV